MQLNETSLDTLCGALCEIMGVELPAHAQSADHELVAYARAQLGKRADRVFMYNPDAIAMWIDEKYSFYMPEVKNLKALRVPFRTVMPSVTPVCFGTMYTGAQPEVHGIRRYEKPVIRIDSLFDVLIREGRKCAIVAETNCSMSKIYLERRMDYYFADTITEVNATAMRLITEDKYDFICVYNGNYDEVMHKFGPESPEALAQLRQNSAAFGTFLQLIKKCWTSHDTLAGFAMDHGCHEIDGHCGSHGLDMPEDLNICHYYTCLPHVK